MAKASIAYASDIAGVGLRKIDRFHPGRCSSIASSPQPLPLPFQKRSLSDLLPTKGPRHPSEPFSASTTCQILHLHHSQKHPARVLPQPQTFPHKREKTSKRSWRNRGSRVRDFLPHALYKQEMMSFSNWKFSGGRSSSSLPYYVEKYNASIR